MLEHKEYKRLCETANTAILFVHGIIGTPNHFNDFIKTVPADVSVYNMLLDGHGGSVKDFSGTSMKKWEAQMQRVIAELSETHEKIYIVAHSMGTLLAMEQAVSNDKIAKLFLLAVPLKIAPKAKMFLNSAKVYLNRVNPQDAYALAAKNCYGIGQEKNPLKYIGWMPRFFELFVKARHTRNLAKRLITPCAVYQSVKDEMVSMGSIRYFKDNPNIEVVKLPKSAHYYYDENDFRFLLDEFKRFVG